ncbi:helix-turn-helix domain-containing protein [Maribacter chungangensis]|uniref:Helix-turn-helix domain-containing protein n=1 Tax=Maribacter chungangensis TaxID=1069117 RepID=A0ABW3B8H1_9FLAO
MYKVPAPLTFLIFPLAYLYIRAVLHGEKRLKLRDGLHLIPFLFFTINYLPFYLMDLSEKTTYVWNITQNFELSYSGQDGMLPEWFNIVCRAVLSVCYLLLQWHLIISFFKSHANQGSRQFNTVKKWVFNLTTIQTVYNTALLFLYIFNALSAMDFIANFNEFKYVVSFLVNGSFLVLACYLLWNPHLLVGLPKLHLKTEQPENVLPLSRIHALIVEQNSFLSPILTVHSLSKAIGVPSRRISTSIGHSKYSNFNDYINHLRICYAVEKINEGYLKTYSVDALSEISGFNSKNAFYRAFKKTHGCTPLKYQKAS